MRTNRSKSAAGGPGTAKRSARSWWPPPRRQVYCWDITKLAGPAKGIYYDAYVMIDIYCRYIVGVHVDARECGVLATEMMEQIFGTYGVPHVVHADRGTSMTSNSVAGLLAELGVTGSH